MGEVAPLMLFKEKMDVTIKVGACSGGEKQIEITKKEGATSLTVTM